MKNSTPTPWKTDLEICPVTGSISIYANGPILYVHDNTNGPENQKANAALIVRAVNSHQALVDACRSALADMSDMQGVRLEEACPVTFEKLRAALALATK